MSFRPVPSVPDFPALERAVLEFWRDRAVFAALRERNSGGEPWSFLDGPITANNPMGVHHAWGRSYKDLFQRYHAMCGRKLRYQNGFDCQGLWVEVEVEKALGFTSKRQIREFGLDAFVRRCKQRVLTYAARQTEQSIRLGYWTDWDDPDTLRRLAKALGDGDDTITVTTPSGETVTDHPERVIGRLGSPELGGSYFTFSTENNFTIWSFLKKCHTEGHLYRGTDVMPWCCRCGTGLSQMEVAEGRKITKHLSVYVRFPLRDRRGRDQQGREQQEPRGSLLVWTTTPWTLTSNVAAAVNPESTYVRLRYRDDILIVGKDNLDHARVQDLSAGGQSETHKLPSLRGVLKFGGDVTILGELKGAELVGLTYDGPFDHLDAQQRPGGLSPVPTDSTERPVDAHRVVAWSEVSGSEGTGIVHIAPGCGAEDRRLGLELGLPAIAPLDEAGHYLDGFGAWTGRQASEVGDEIARDLKDRGLLVARERYPHVYPHCWRCKEELVFRTVDEWFIRMDWRDRIAAVVPDARWIPPDGEARELDWLKNMGDWMISKKRFWGLALPIWVCDDCEHFDVIGGDDELKARAIDGLDVYAGHTPHRPFVDAVKIRCGECGGTASRIPDVGNPWLDAGIVPLSTMGWRTDRDEWARWFPADFVVECFPGQFRNWFYALLSMSAMMTDAAPFKVLLGHALVRDERGEEMHKSAGNAIAFDEAAEVIGAEVMRYLYARQNPVQNLNFPDLPPPGARPKKGSLATEIRRRLLTWWNCYSFFVTYATADAWRGPISTIPVAERSGLDRWILSRLQRLVQDAHRGFADFAVYRFTDRFESFIDELSNWYLRRSRRRFWGSEPSADKTAAYETLYAVLTTVNRLMAPIVPFLTEEIHGNLTAVIEPDAPVSVHLLPYPQAREEWIDAGLEDRVAAVLRVRNLALSLRNDARIKVRQPLPALHVRPGSAAERAAMEDPTLSGELLEECNVKALHLLEADASLTVTTVGPNYRALGRRLGRKMKATVAALGAAPAGQVAAALAAGESWTLDVGGEAISITAGDVVIGQAAPDHLRVGEEGDTLVALDIRISPELAAEGLARDFCRHVQTRRKAMGLDVSDRITLEVVAGDKLDGAVAANRAFLVETLLAPEIHTVDGLPDDDRVTAVKLAGEQVRFRVTPVSGSAPI